MLAAVIICFEERNDLLAFVDTGLRFLSVDKRACLLEEIWRLRILVGISGSRASLWIVDSCRKAQAKSKDKSKPGNHARYYACGLAGISSRLDNARHSFIFPAFLLS